MSKYRYANIQSVEAEPDRGRLNSLIRNASFHYLPSTTAIIRETEYLNIELNGTRMHAVTAPYK